MAQVASARPWSLGAALPLILAAALHQGFAAVAPPTVAPPTPAPPTPAPPRGPGRPERGQYQVLGSNGTVCLLASMGLQLNISSQDQVVQDVLNIKPNLTKASGSCDLDRAVLQLVSDADRTSLSLVFILNTTSRKFYLGEASVTAALPDVKEPFWAQNLSLDYLRGHLGFSYLCRQEQSLMVASNLSINVFQVQVQPFGVVGDQFGAAEECQLDQDDMLVPIIVGGALAGLVLVVLLAYLIGRRRSHAGYQTI